MNQADLINNRKIPSLNLLEDIVEFTNPSNKDFDRIKALLNLVDHFKLEQHNNDPVSKSLQQIKDLGFELKQDSPEYWEKEMLNIPVEQALNEIQKSYEIKVNEWNSIIQEENEKISNTSFKPITDINILPIHNKEYIISTTSVSGGLATIYKAFHIETGDIVALKINDKIKHDEKLNKEKSENVEKADKGRRKQYKHILHRNSMNDLFGIEFIEMPWYDTNLGKFLENDDETVKYFKNGLDINIIDKFSRRLTSMVKEHKEKNNSHITDLKPANIMVEENLENTEDNMPDLYLSDIGLSTPVDRSKASPSRTSTGTIEVRSPKLFKDSTNTNIQDSIFAVASNIYNLFTGEFLFQNEITNYDKKTLDDFMDSLLVEGQVNRNVMDSILNEKFKGTKIPKPYQEVIRTAVLGEYEDTTQLKNGLIDAKESYDNRFKKYFKILRNSIATLGVAGLLMIGANYQETGSITQTVKNLSNFHKVEQINPRTLSDDKIILDKLFSGNKFGILAETKYSNISEEEMELIIREVSIARTGGFETETITPFPIFFRGMNEGMKATGNDQTQTELVIDYFKNNSEGNEVQNKIIYSVLNSMKKMGCTMEQDFFKKYNSKQFSYAFENSWFNINIDDVLDEEYGLTKEDFPTAKARTIEKIRTYFTLNLARNYNKTTGKIDMENFMVELLFGPERLNEAMHISEKTDFIGYTNSVEDNKQILSDEQLEFTRKVKKETNENIEFYRQNPDSLAKLSSRGRLFYTLAISNYEKNEYYNNLITNTESNNSTEINRDESEPAKVNPSDITSPAHHLIKKRTIPTFNTTDRIVMQYVLNNLQNDLDKEIVPYLEGQENEILAIANSITTINEQAKYGELPELNRDYKKILELGSILEIHIKTQKLLRGNGE